MGEIELDLGKGLKGSLDIKWIFDFWCLCLDVLEAFATLKWFQLKCTIPSNSLKVLESSLERNWESI